MNPVPGQPQTCSPLDLSSAAMLRRLESLLDPTLKAIEANGYYSDLAKAAAGREVRALVNNLRNQVTLAVADSRTP